VSQIYKRDFLLQYGLMPLKIQCITYIAKASKFSGVRPYWRSSSARRKTCESDSLLVNFKIQFAHSDTNKHVSSFLQILESEMVEDHLRNCPPLLA